jgi:hypothetical protein
MERFFRCNTEPPADPGSLNTGAPDRAPCARRAPSSFAMKKVRTTRKVRINIAKKRHARILRSKAKQAHRRGTGYKEMEESNG